MFETLMEMLNHLEDCGDVIMFTIGEEIHVDFCDFEGFASDWSEVMRDYEDEDTVDAVFDMLQTCEQEGDYYVTYMVEGHKVQVGFTSYDI